MSACKRVVPLGFNAYSSYLVHKVKQRQISQFVKANGELDRLALLQSLEARDMPSKQAEAITAAIAEVSQSFVSKAEMAKMLQEANLSKFMSKVKSSQEHHFSVLRHETEKLRGDREKMRSELRHENGKLGGDREKMGSELRYEVENATGGQRQEIHALRAQSEDEKFKVITRRMDAVACIFFVSVAVVVLIRT